MLTAWGQAPEDVEAQHSFCMPLPDVSGEMTSQGSWCMAGVQASGIGEPFGAAGEAPFNTWHVAEAPAATCAQMPNPCHQQFSGVDAASTSPSSWHVTDEHVPTLAEMHELWQSRQASQMGVSFGAPLPAVAVDSQATREMYELREPFPAQFPVTTGNASSILDVVPPPPCQPPVLNAAMQPSALPPPPVVETARWRNNRVEKLRNARLPKSTPPAPQISAGKELPAPVLRLSEALLAPVLGSEQLPSIGSATHHLGGCRPCAFLHTRGCENAEGCPFCHLCEPGEKKRRLKEKRVARREAKYSALVARSD